MKTIFIKPRKGLIVRDPQTLLPLADEGEEKPDTAYWRRRLRDTDVERAKAPAPKPAGGKDK